MKRNRLFSVVLSLCLLMASATAWGQAVGDYGSAGTGNWGTDGTNWVICVADGTWDGATVATVAPSSTVNVWIRATHTVTAEVTGKNCKNLTVESNGNLITTSGFIVGAASTVLTLQANSTWKQNGTSSSLPCTTKSFDNTSTVEFNGSQSSLSVFTYGNLIWSSSSTCGISQGNTLTVNGNLTLNKNMRGNSSTTGSNTHTIAGNVTVNGSGVYLSGVNNTAATTGVAIWNIGGNVNLTGGARIVLFESAGPHTGTSTFNIGGNLEIGTGSAINLRTSTTVNVSAGTGTVNVKGNVINNGAIQTANGTTGGVALMLNLNGTSEQQWTGVFPVTFPAGQSATIQINNGTGVVLNSSVNINSLNTLLFTNGVLKLGANNLSVLTGGAISGTTSSNFIVTNGTGTLTMPAVASVATILPIGASATSYDPISVTPTTTTDFSAKVGTTLSGVPASGYQYNVKEWDLTPAIPSSTVISFTPSAITATGPYNIIGHYEGGDYVNKLATLSAGSYTGTYSTFSPFVTGTSDTATGLNITKSANFVSVSGNEAIVNGTSAGDVLKVFNTSGQLVKQLKGKVGNTAIQLSRGIYLIKHNNTTIKVII